MEGGRWRVEDGGEDGGWSEEGGGGMVEAEGGRVEGGG